MELYLRDYLYEPSVFNEAIVSAGIVDKEENNAAAFLHLRNHFGSQTSYTPPLGVRVILRGVKRSTYLASPALRRKRKEKNLLLD